MRDVWIVMAVRTAIGKLQGSLRSVPTDDLASTVMREVVGRARVDAGLVDDVIFGCCIQAGPFSNIARLAALKAGFPESVPGITVDRRCASGLEAVNLGALKIAAGDADAIVCGGVENMTRAPYYLEKWEDPYKRGPHMLKDSFGGPRTQPESMYGDLTMGLTAETVAERYQVSRKDQDGFAFQSQERTASAIRLGRFTEEILPVEISDGKRGKTVFAIDEHPRSDSTLEKLAALKPAFKKDGTVTAGNSSGINDGAAAMLLVAADTGNRLGLTPLARFRSCAVSAIDPRVMGIAPVDAMPKALQKAGLSLDEVGLIELNEAFASQSLACIRQLKLPMDKVNVNGGAIALGHPIGASGARILVTLLHELKRRDERFGVASLCVGGGQGVATVVERIRS
jgi:acetyl-CoA C-acetyltransferase